MARTKTIHTPPADEVAMNTITFPQAKLSEFGRVDAASGWIKFRCSLPKGYEKLFELMDWQVPDTKTMLEKLEGTLKGGHLILTSKEKLVDAEVDIEFDTIKDFACLRLELEGRKKKGFRRELRFSATYKCPDGAANLENYMMRVPDAIGSLKVTYLKEAVQEEMELQDQQANLIPEGVHATDEQRKAVMGLN